MIINIEEIFKRLSDGDDWEPVEFINHRNERLRFEQVATVELDGKNYAYLHEIGEDGERVTDFSAVVQFEDKDGEYIIDFVTDENLIDDVAYEVFAIRAQELPEETDSE